MPQLRYLASVIIFVFYSLNLSAQYDAPLYTSYTTAIERAKMHDRIIKNTITKNLSLPLSDSTEDNWQQAFDAMEVFDFKTLFTQQKIETAFDSLANRSASFQRALLELVYTNHSGHFISQTKSLLNKTTSPKIFAMSAEYILQHKNDSLSRNGIAKKLFEKFGDSVYQNPILFMLTNRLQASKHNAKYAGKEILKEILNKNFLPNKIVMYSFQRKNRDYPGMVLIRNANGELVTDSLGNIFHIPQLARSITNLPGYLTNGNTPQGIFRMYGFDISMSNFIGPTANVQMGMPLELSKKKFFDDSTITDSVWNINDYRKLIPANLWDYFPLYESYYAGLAGRSEIIAHGTTLDPNLYSNKPYFPLTPTQGCLCTKEIWNGRRLESDQQKLVNGLLKAGGANGYVVVIEIDNKNAPVTIDDIIPYLKKG
ncbi:MAG: hypothetical protein ABI172_10535 [Ginsengibacter sp.]